MPLKSYYFSYSSSLFQQPHKYRNGGRRLSTSHSQWVLSMKILIAEDDAVSRLLLTNYLSKWEYDITVAETGLEAWEKFQEGDFPLVICDWMMPDLEGPELIKKIRASDKPGYVYTILLTAKTNKGDLVEGMESGADDFVTKPFSHDELRMRLRAGERIVQLEQSLRAAQEELKNSREE